MSTNVNEAVSAYWVKHYVGKDGLCVLCGNSGIVKVHRETVLREEHFCFCPNGQAKRFYSK